MDTSLSQVMVVASPQSSCASAFKGFARGSRILMRWVSPPIQALIFNAEAQRTAEHAEILF